MRRHCFPQMSGPRRHRADLGYVKRRTRDSTSGSVVTKPGLSPSRATVKIIYSPMYVNVLVMKEIQVHLKVLLILGIHLSVNRRLFNPVIRVQVPPCGGERNCLATKEGMGAAASPHPLLGPGPNSEAGGGWGRDWRWERALTLTCSFEVTAQKTISVKPWVGNMRKQIPPMTRPSLIKARVLCFLRGEGTGHIVPICPPNVPKLPTALEAWAVLGAGN